jgi:hypothetical protein
MVGSLLCVGFAGEGEFGGLEIELHVLVGDIWYGEGEIDEVLCGVAVAGALSPED